MEMKKMETGETVTRKKRYEPIDDDYDLVAVRFEEAENGVVVSCEYHLKDAVRDKLRKQEPHYYYDSNDTEKHVFEDKAGAKTFIIGELDAMWGKS